MKTWRRSICLGSLLLVPLAAKKLLRTADRHALCFAYSKIKRYDKLMPCFDRLQQRISSGDLYTRLLDTQEPFKHPLISSPRYNLDRAARRAQSVVNYLQSKGVETARLESVGKGFTELLNNTDPLAAENRRVRIKALP